VLFKIARFAFELSWIKTEIEVYHDLAQKGSRLGPQLLGCVFEGPKKRVFGFLLKEISGRPAALSDLDDCKAGLQRLHDSGFVHGDPVKDNIFMTELGLRFIDFEEAHGPPVDDPERWKTMKEQDLQKLAMNLMNPSGEGRPWD
jgi:hypothetical protein